MSSPLETVSTQNSNESAKEAAFALLAVIDEREGRYDAANATLTALNRDFPLRVEFVDPEVWGAMVKLLNAVLGDIAEYYLHEARHMKGGGACSHGNQTWPISSVDDVRAYVRDNPPT